MARDTEALYTAKYLIVQLNISDKYLRRIMTNLARAGFITSIQGRDGGYRFNKDTGSITLADIIDAAEGMNRYTGCVLGFSKCSDENPCVMHPIWAEIRDQFTLIFRKKTLKDLNFNNIRKF